MMQVTGRSSAMPEMSFRARAGLILGSLVIANIGTWLLALGIVDLFPVLIGSIALAYGLGLRHAFDADHIAAIDNVTRRLVAAGQRPAGVGFFFSLGHSTVVVVGAAGIAFAAGQFKNHFASIEYVTAPYGTAFSSIFLITISILNILVFIGLWRALRRSNLGAIAATTDKSCATIGGFFSRRLNFVVGAVTRSWMMYPLGVLFAVGFDTATEIGILGLAASHAAKGLPIWSILIFPALFAVGMALADTVEALLMLSAYRWTGSNPRSQLRYNLAITAMSVVVGLAVAVVQLIGLLPHRTSQAWTFTVMQEVISQRSEWIGVSIFAAFLVIWSGWALIDRALRGPFNLRALGVLQNRN